MDETPIVGIGPYSPPITGPGLKNKYLKEGLEERGYTISWVNTLKRSPSTLIELLQRYRDGTRFLVSASTKVRFGTALFLSRKLSRPDVRGALLPAGGAFATELRNLPPGIRGQYLKLFSRFDCILPEVDTISADLQSLFDDRVYVSTLPNLRSVPDDPPDFDRFAGADRVLRLVYIGRIKEQKGLHLLLSAVDAINADDERVSLDVFGHFLEGDDYRERFVNTCRATSNATFLGKLEGDVIRRLRDYDAFVFPTYYPGEGVPGALIEAFAAGCLVVASDWNYNDQLVTDGEDGLLFEPQSVPDLQDKIEWLLEHPTQVDHFKHRSWEKAQCYSVDAVIGQLTTHLERSGW